MSTSQPVAENTVKVSTTRFGEVDVSPDRIITLPLGMVGFSEMRRYVVLQHKEGSPFHWLQSTEQPSLAFVLMNPLMFDPEYSIGLGPAESKLLQITDPNQIQVWSVVTIPHGKPENMTANLKAPLVINLQNGLGAQVILDDPRYSVRHAMKKDA